MLSAPGTNAIYPAIVFLSITAHLLILSSLAMTSPSILWRESLPTSCSPDSPSLPNLHEFVCQEIAVRKLPGQHHVWSVTKHRIRICQNSKHSDLGHKKQSTKLAHDSHQLS